MAEEKPSMIIKYWGVRGSVPTSLTTEQIRAKQLTLLREIRKKGGLNEILNWHGELKGDADWDKELQFFLDELPLSISGTYGGDTTCIEVQTNSSPLIVIDAGTGARELGRTLIGRLFSTGRLNPLNSMASARDLHMFFTHYHWDHIQGLPFFNPVFVPGQNKVDIHFYGRKGATQQLSDVLKGQQQYPNFPVTWEDMPCRKKYHELGRLDKEEIMLGNAKVTYTELTHPDAVFAYAIEVDGKKFVCATDTEHKDRPDPRLVKLAKDAKIMYYDAQYTPEEYEGQAGTLTGPVPKFDWGHSTYEWAVKNALAANVETVVLGHLEPVRDDFKTEQLLDRAIAYKNQQLSWPENAGKKLNVIMAYQGLEQRL